MRIGWHEAGLAGTASGRVADSRDRLFDTAALIDLYRGRRLLLPRLQAVVEGNQRGYISVVSEAELWRGVRPEEIARHEALLAAFIPIPLESATARVAGRWMRIYETDGLGWMDSLIAATAREAGLTLLTRDARLAQVLAAEVSFEVYPAR